LGMGDWAQSPIPNPQSPIPNPQSPFVFELIIINLNYNLKINNYLSIKIKLNIKNKIYEFNNNINHNLPNISSFIYLTERTLFSEIIRTSLSISGWSRRSQFQSFFAIIPIFIWTFLWIN